MHGIRRVVYVLCSQQTFDDEKVDMKQNVDELRRMYHKVEQVTTHTEHIPKQSSTRTQVQKSVHEVMQGTLCICDM